MPDPNPSKARAPIRLRARLAPAIAMTALLSLSAVAQAGHSSTPHPFKDASIGWDPGGRGTPPTVLVAHDGTSYTHLVGTISTRFRLKAKVKSGHRIYGWTITTGDPTFTDRLPAEDQGAHDGTYKKSIDRPGTFTMDAVRAVTGGTPGISLTVVQDIVGMCNNAFATPPPTDRTVGQLQLTVHAGFSAGPYEGADVITWAGWYPAGAQSRPAIAHTSFPVNVVCLNRTDPRVGEIAPPKPVSVDIRVKQKGNSCPKATEVTAYIDFKQPTTARFRVIHNGKKSKPIKIKARKVTLAGKTWYRIERMQRYKLDPGNHSFRIKVIGGGKSRKKTIKVDCPPFKVSSAWLTYEVENKRTCKKKVVERAAFYANRPGDIPVPDPDPGRPGGHPGHRLCNA